MPTFTPNLNLTKPIVGASEETWGDELNAALDTLDTKVFDKTTGGTVTGDVAVTGNVSTTGNITTVNLSVVDVNSTGNISTTGNLSADGFSTASGVVTATSYNGAGTGLTGYADALSIGGNALTSTSTSSLIQGGITYAVSIVYPDPNPQNLATVNTVNQAMFQTVLPDQLGNPDTFLYTDGVTASWKKINVNSTALFYGSF